MDALVTSFESITLLGFLGQGPQHHIASCFCRGHEPNSLKSAYNAWQRTRSKHQETDRPCPHQSREPCWSSFFASFQEQQFPDSSRSIRTSCNSSATSTAISTCVKFGQQTVCCGCAASPLGILRLCCHHDSMKHPLSGWRHHKNAARRHQRVLILHQARRPVCTCVSNFFSAERSQ